MKLHRKMFVAPFVAIVVLVATRITGSQSTIVTNSLAGLPDTCCGDVKWQLEEVVRTGKVDRNPSLDRQGGNKGRVYQ